MPVLRNVLVRWLDRRESWVWLLGLGLVLRLVLLLFAGNEPLQSDALYYHQMAARLAEGDLGDLYWPPGLPLFEAAIMWVFGQSAFLARLSMLVFFAWLGRGTYNLVYRIHSRPAANLALLFLCIYPEFIHHSVEPLSQLPSAALVVAMVNLLLRYLDGDRKGTLPRLGLVLGCLVLLRPSSILLCLLVPAWILFQRRKVMAAAVVLVFSLALPAAWVYYASNAQGRLVPVNDANSRNFFLGNNPWTPEYKTWYLGSHWAGAPEIPTAFRKTLDSLDALPVESRGKAYMAAAGAHIQAQPGRFLLQSFNRLKVFFAFDSFTGARLHPPTGAYPMAGKVVLAMDAVLYSLVLVGWILVVLGGWKGELPGNIRWLSVAVVAMYALPYVFSFSHPSYHLPVLPLMAALGLVPVSLWIFPKGRPFRLPKGGKAWWAVAFVLVVLALQIEWVLRMRG